MPNLTASGRLPNQPGERPGDEGAGGKGMGRLLRRSVDCVRMGQREQCGVATPGRRSTEALRTATVSERSGRLTGVDDLSTPTGRRAAAAGKTGKECPARTAVAAAVSTRAGR